MPTLIPAPVPALKTQNESSSQTPPRTWSTLGMMRCLRYPGKPSPQGIPSLIRCAHMHSVPAPAHCPLELGFSRPHLQ